MFALLTKRRWGYCNNTILGGAGTSGVYTIFGGVGTSCVCGTGGSGASFENFEKTRPNLFEVPGTQRLEPLGGGEEEGLGWKVEKALPRS